MDLHDLLVRFLGVPACYYEKQDAGLEGATSLIRQDFFLL